MAEGEKLTGMSKYFNSVTMQGRANVSKATLGTVVLIGLYLYLKPKKNKSA